MWQPSRTVFGRYLCVWLLVAALTGVVGGVQAREGNGRRVHVVYQGQRLGSIAKRYNVSIDAICEANGIRRRDPIHPGQRLEIPPRETTRKKADAAQEANVVAEAKATKPTTLVAAQATAKPMEAAVKGAVTTALPVSKETAANPPTGQPKAIPSADQAPSLSKMSLVSAEPTRKLSTESATLGSSDPVMLGAAGVSHRVAAGESLSGIAVHYQTNVKTLLQLNKLRRDQLIRVGQVLTIPRAATNGSWWAKFARSPRAAGELEVFAHTHRWKGKVVVKGKVQPAGRAALSRLLGATGSAPPIPERLIQLLAHVSDTFGGRPIRLVSGYRTNSYAKDSRHRHSSAIDFSITGVPNSAVRDYLLQLGNVGVGYYPNSTFVHLDVRARSAYWVDYAGPGEAPRKAPRANRRFASDAPKGTRRATTTRVRSTLGANDVGNAAMPTHTGGRSQTSDVNL